MGNYKGKRNIYMCDDCGHGFKSVDVDDGVTPFLTKCLRHECNGTAKSFCYNIPQSAQERGVVAVEWYSPKSQELKHLPNPTRDHVAKGGLISRLAK